ncbi:MAG: hypothetical protein R3183_04175 [Oleiphilaceae bacterium]|nr:hypothetical protein [Oleiphilaceae bacterium]
MKHLLALLAMSILAGCAQGDAQQTNKPNVSEWAVIDTGKITNELRELAKKQNPYPDGVRENAYDIVTESRKVQATIRGLEQESQKGCEVDLSKKPKQPLLIDSYKEIKAYDKSCVEGQLNASSYKDQLDTLKNKLEALNNEKELNAKHRRKLDDAAKNYLPQIVKTYAGDQFSLVLDRHANVVYSSTGILIDVTEALSNHLSENPPTIDIQ